jgi:hypothetical protein
MVFVPPAWVPKINRPIPDSISIFDFIFDEQYGRLPLKESRPFFTCGVSGQSFTPLEVKKRVDYLARGLANELGWKPNSGTEWDKVIGVFSANTVSMPYQGTLDSFSPYIVGYIAPSVGNSSTLRDPKPCQRSVFYRRSGLSTQR